MVETTVREEKILYCQECNEEIDEVCEECGATIEEGNKIECPEHVHSECKQD
jgi:hypothetical protein